MRLLELESTRESKSKKLYEIILAIMLSLGCWGGIFVMLGSPAIALPGLLAAAILPPAFLALARVKLIGRFAAAYTLVIVAVFILLFYKAFWNGLMQLANYAIDYMNSQGDFGYLNYQVTGANQVLLALIPMIIITSAAIGQSIADRSPVWAFFFTVIPMIVLLVVGGRPSPIMLVIMLVAWIGLFLLDSRGSRLPVLCASLVILSALALTFTLTSWQPLAFAQDAKASIIRFEENLRYGGGDIENLSQGNLADTHPLNYDDRAVFKLEMELGQSIYLRGFTGADFSYDKEKWTLADDSNYAGKNRGLCQWLMNEDYYPWCQQNSLYRLTEDYSFSDVEVTNVRASSKYTWIPYETAVTGEMRSGYVKYDNDRALYSKGFRGDRSYKVRIFNSNLKLYSDVKGQRMLKKVKLSSEYEDYAQKEAVYRSFVYDNYTDVDEESKAALASTGIEACKDKVLDYTLYYIRDMFDKEYKYDIETDAAPKGETNLDYFINKSKTGNCMHFATAATLMLREAGFPARYAEGYYLEPELFDAVGNAKVTIADSAAHAWVEVYVDELGWMPVEVTPGYYDMAKQLSEEEEETEKLQETSKETVPEEKEVDNASSRLPAENNLWKKLLGILAVILALIAIYEAIGRYIVKRPRGMETSYKYICKTLGMAGIKIKKDPYGSIDTVAKSYDEYTEMKYEEVIGLLYRVRFGEMPLSTEESKMLESYSRELAAYIYCQVPWYKRVVMKGILFLL